jgi:hypothetical protein
MKKGKEFSSVKQRLQVQNGYTKPATIILYPRIEYLTLYKKRSCIFFFNLVRQSGCAKGVTHFLRQSRNLGECPIILFLIHTSQDVVCKSNTRLLGRILIRGPLSSLRPKRGLAKHRQKSDRSGIVQD